ncbi:WD40-repeat-containing domain protein [Phycomyces nitens]|nr:WD40-repeat-containing domain protein [Phycomyces nitens]
MQVPEPIPLDDHVFDFAFHPKEPILVAGLINGHVHCYRYGIKGNQQVWSTQLSRKSCRGVEFTPDGSVMISISRDRSIQKVDVQTGRLSMRIPKAHKYPINKLCIIDDNMMSTGDDEGVVKIWDQRTQKAVKEYKVHEDFISDMAYNPGQGPSLVVAG